MSLLFSQSVRVQTAFSTSPDDEQVAYIGSSLWNSLKSDYDDLFISISSLKQHSLPSLGCLARRSEAIQDGIVVPELWLAQHKHIFSSSHVLVTPTSPILLTQVYATALSPAAYDAAMAHDSFLERLFCDKKRILRQGSVYSADLAHARLEFRIDVLEPVLQGFAEINNTAFIVTCLEEEDESETLSLSSDDESVEIDQEFLANSVADPLQKRLEEDDMVFQTRSLSRPASAQDDHTLYLRTADLGRLGVLSGDWVVARCPENTHSRLVKVMADDTTVSTLGQSHGSPLLLHNLIRENRLSLLSLHPSPFGSREPAVPIAHSITIARVASPLSINKQYQTSFLDALKTHFSLRRRLVKQGDLVAVGIDTDSTMRDDDDEQFPATPSRNNEVVFFMITNVEYNLPPSDNKNSAVDTYFGSTAGELGCWFDPDSTRMVQAGMDHSFIPDVNEYLGTGQALASTGASIQKLLSISSVVLERQVVDYNLQLSILLKGARGIGKFTAASLVSRHLGLHILEVNCYDIIGETDIKTEAFLRARFENAIACSPCMLVLRHLEAFAQSTQRPENGKEPVIVNVVRDCIQSAHHAWKSSGYPVITCGTTSMVERVPTGLLSCLKHEVSFEAPDEQERYRVLDTLLQSMVISPDVSLSHLAQQTAAFLPGDLHDLVTRAEAAAVSRAVVSDIDETSVFSAGVSLTNADFTQALGQARASYSESIGAPKIPSVSWDDVGGLAQVKADILDTIQLPLDHPELFADGLKKRSGILLYGPPGTGKTLVAKAVATSFSLNFFSVKGPELLNMYIGESEANVRRVFQRARDAKPCVIFFDELDSIAPKRGNQGDSGGVMDRIVSQLLAELDGSGSTGDVFVIGATNRPDLLDAALLRPGRFDRMLYLGVSETHAAQLNILEALTRKFRLHPDLALKQVADECSLNYTGADFYALCSDALLNAMTRKAEELESKLAFFNRQPELHPDQPHPLTPQYYLAEMASEEDVRVEVTKEDFDVALKGLVPSVSQAEMDHYRTIQDRFSREKTG
ncbi:AAA-domain-containing protein [Gymnopus androsaceus JB14]|uniref:Peroxisomal ATPase PEX6 n=1 Tax=Gymnopus androsaceus JB14 TaxID=1447944 RepID=A0A6A4GV90_9AGAR|nr:AAA-domain-containing protein [Gymnopus androsaceus JB14]